MIEENVIEKSERSQKKDELMNKVKTNVSSEITKNNAFSKVFDYIYTYMINTFDSDNFDLNFNDEKTVVTISKIGVSTNVMNEKLKDNKSAIVAKIILSQNSELISDISYGILYDFETFASVLAEEEKNKLLSRYKNAKAILNTEYRYEVYNKNGIAISYGSYHDNGFALSGLKENEDIITQITKIHKPVFEEEFCKTPELYENRKYTAAHRTGDNLGMIYVLTVKNDKKKEQEKKEMSNEIYHVNMDHPENLLWGKRPLAVWNKEDEKYDIEQEFFSEIEDIEGLKEKVSKMFRQFINGNNQKERFDGILKTINNM